MINILIGFDALVACLWKIRVAIMLLQHTGMELLDCLAHASDLYDVYGIDTLPSDAVDRDLMLWENL